LSSSSGGLLSGCVVPGHVSAVGARQVGMRYPGERRLSTGTHRADHVAGELGVGCEVDQLQGDQRCETGAGQEYDDTDEIRQRLAVAQQQAHADAEDHVDHRLAEHQGDEHLRGLAGPRSRRGPQPAGDQEWRQGHHDQDRHLPEQEHDPQDDAGDQREEHQDEHQEVRGEAPDHATHLLELHRHVGHLGVEVGSGDGHDAVCQPVVKIDEQLREEHIHDATDAGDTDADRGASECPRVPAQPCAEQRQEVDQCDQRYREADEAVVDVAVGRVRQWHLSGLVHDLGDLPEERRQAVDHARGQRIEAAVGDLLASLADQVPPGAVVA
jgi:hypothetical protein